MQFLIFLIGLPFICIGVFAKMHSNRMHKLGLIKAKVFDYQPAVKKIGETEIPCKQVML